MQTTINKEIIKRYRDYGLSLDYLGSVIFLLLALYEEDYDILDTFDDGNKERTVLTLYQTLYRRGFLEANDEETIYNLTDKGIDFVEYINSFYGKRDAKDARSDVRNEQDNREPHGHSTNPEEADRGSISQDRETGTRASTQVRGEKSAPDVSEWIEAWIELFPREKIQGRYLRTNKHECADRMRWFMKEYSYDMDTIFKATSLYLETQELSPSGHTFTRNTSYFIFKGRSKSDRTSDLATWCQRALDEGHERREYIERDVI